MFSTIRAGFFILCASAATLVNAAEINMPETFGDGGAPDSVGWTFNLGGAVADAGAGGVGDHALNYIAAGGSGFHFLHPFISGPNNPDYLVAGVTAIRFDARHDGVGDDVVLRATVFDTFGDGVDWGTSTVPVTIPTTATTWQTYQLSLDSADLTAGGANGIPLPDILAAVEQVGLRHDPLGTGPETPSPVSVTTSVFFDNVELIPEPCSGLLLILGVIGLVNVRHRR